MNGADSRVRCDPCPRSSSRSTTRLWRGSKSANAQTGSSSYFTGRHKRSRRGDASVRYLQDCEPFPLSMARATKTPTWRAPLLREQQAGKELRKPSTEELVAAGALLLIALAEVVTAYVNPVFGVGFHVVLLVVFLGLGSSTRKGPRRAFFLALAIGPLIRIISLAMPLGSIPQTYWYVLTAVPLFAAGALIARNLEMSPAALNLTMLKRRNLWIEIPVALSGLVLGFVEWSILRVQPMVNGQSVAWMIAGALILLIFTGLFEEFIFRGLIQGVSINFLGPLGGVIFAALIFSVLHIGWHSILDLLFALGVGVYFSLIVLRTTSLWGVTVAHGAISTMVFIVVPLLLVPIAVSWPQSLVIHWIPSGSTVTLHWRYSPLAKDYRLEVADCSQGALT